MSNRMPKILTSPTKNAREVVNPDFTGIQFFTHLQAFSMQLHAIHYTIGMAFLVMKINFQSYVYF